MAEAPMQPHPGIHTVEEDAAAAVGQLGDRARRFAGKTVLITGASGFLASYVADIIAHMNTTILDGSPARLVLIVRTPTAPMSRLAHLAGRSDVSILEHDVNEPLPIDERIDFIVHAASPASPVWYRKDPVSTGLCNSQALNQLLELAVRDESESVLFLPTSEAYGDPEPECIPTPETYVGRVDTLGGRACYAESKRFGETLCRAYWDQHDVPVKIARPFHMYGPGLRLNDGRIVPEMYRNALEGKPLELMSDGRATRTFGYASDAAVGFLLVLLSDMNGEAFNVGADEPETSMLDLVTMISKLFGYEEEVKVNTGGLPEHLCGAPNRACPDLAKIRTALGYAPSVPLDAGLRRMRDWFVRAREAGVAG